MTESDDSLIEFYSSQQMSGQLETFLRQRRELQKLSEGGFRPRRVLDFGCGTGHGAETIFHGFDLDVFGLDIVNSVEAEFVSRTGGVFVLGQGGRAPFPDDSFDVVLLNEVIEHVVDTDALIGEVHRILSPTGFLFLSTPNLAAWFNRLALLIGMQPAFTEVSFDRIFGRPGEQPVGHLRIFTRRALFAFLEYHSFEMSVVASAPFRSLPKALFALDSLAARVPSLGADLIVVARKRSRESS